MNKFVIYTAVIGQYDEILQPKVIDPRFDYILFSNDIHETSIGVWQIRHFSYHNDIQTKIARWIKTHPEQLLPEYEASLWMDANIQIASSEFYSRVDELYGNKTSLSTVKHPKLTCIYQEMLVMIYGRYEKESVVVNWGHFLRKQNFPRDNGIVETGVLFRNHSVPTIKEFDKQWWWCIDNYSRRDQLSFNYVLWKLKLQFEPFFEEGITVRNSQMVNYEEIHSNETKKWINLGKWEAWLGRYVSHDRSRSDQIEKLYYWIYGTKFPHFWTVVFGQLFRVKDIIVRRFSG